MQTRVIGLLGGIGPASTALYYDLLIDRALDRWGGVPELLLYSLDFQKFTDLENNDPAAYVDLVTRGCRALQRAGAEILAMAANSPHAVYEAVERRVDTPLVHIAEAVCIRGRERGVRSALLLGIPFTLRSGFYDRIGDRHGIRIVLPGEEHHPLLTRIVFDELSDGRILAGSRAELLDLVADREVDGLILGCTELSLLIEPDHVDIPLLDSTRIHVDAILTAAGQDQPPLTETSK